MIMQILIRIYDVFVNQFWTTRTITVGEFLHGEKSLIDYPDLMIWIMLFITTKIIGDALIVDDNLYCEDEDRFNCLMRLGYDDDWWHHRY